MYGGLFQMSSMTKKRNKRFARKKALKWISDVKRDTINAARRCWGIGKPK